MKKSLIWSTFYFIIIIIVGIYAIIKEDWSTLIIIGVVIGVFIVALLSNYLLDFRINRDNKKLRLHYHQLKNNNCRSVYDNLYMLIFQNKAEDLLKDYLKKERIKGINAINTEIVGIDKISCYYKYNGFEVYIYIKNDNICYLIDTPSKYDGTLNNKQFEEENKINLLINDYPDIESFLKAFVQLMKKIIREIDSFALETIVDDLFNGRLINKLKRFSEYIKLEGYGVAITSFVILLIFFFLLFLGINRPSFFGDTYEKRILGIVVWIALIVLFLSILIYGLGYILTYHKMHSDLKNKRLASISEKPVRIRIIRDQINRYNKVRTLRYIKIYYHKKVLLIPFTNNEIVNNPKKIKACCMECLKIHKKLKYLESSKIVIVGAEQYLAIARKYLT